METKEKDVNSQLDQIENDLYDVKTLLESISDLSVFYADYIDLDDIKKTEAFNRLGYLCCEALSKLDEQRDRIGRVSMIQAEQPAPTIPGESIYKNIINPEEEGFHIVNQVRKAPEIDLHYYGSLIEETVKYLEANRGKYKLMEYLSMAVMAYEKDEAPIFGQRKFNKEDRSSLMWLMSFVVEYLDPSKYPLVNGEKKDEILLKSLKEWREAYYPVISK